LRPSLRRPSTPPLPLRQETQIWPASSPPGRRYRNTSGKPCSRWPMVAGELPPTG